MKYTEAELDAMPVGTVLWKSKRCDFDFMCYRRSKEMFGWVIVDLSAQKAIMRAQAAANIEALGWDFIARSNPQETLLEVCTPPPEQPNNESLICETRVNSQISQRISGPVQHYDTDGNLMPADMGVTVPTEGATDAPMGKE